MKIFAHRGFSGDYPENTLPAFEAASKLQVEGVEFDVQRTKDGVLVVHHDEKIHRTSNGKGHLKDYTFSELRELDFGSWKDKKFKGTQIPTLGEVLRVFKDTHHLLNIEIKTDVVDYPEIEQAIMEQVDYLDMTDRVIYSSFDHVMVEKLLRIAPNNITAVLFEKILVNLHEYGEKIGTKHLHISLNAAKRGVIREDIQKGSIFRVYTVNKIEDYDAMEKLGVEAVFTDVPDVLLKHRKNKS